MWKERKQSINKTTCIAKYSLKSGSYVENQELCESNWAKDSTCYDIKPSKIFCSSNDDCKGIKIAGDIRLKKIFKCVRTWAGQNVCEYNSQTSIWKNFVQNYKNYMNQKK